MARPGSNGSARKGELLLVPVEMIPRVWPSASRLFFGRDNGKGRHGMPPGYDYKRTQTRLTVGVDRLWIAAFTQANGCGCGFNGTAHADRFAGVIVTSVGAPPADRPRKLLLKKKSLTAHFVAGTGLRSWIDDAIEKITAYGIGNGCEQLFLLARRAWLPYMKRFYGRFENVGVARDRMTAKGQDLHHRQQRPGAFRRIEPQPDNGQPYSSLRCSRRRVYIERRAP